MTADPQAAIMMQARHADARPGGGSPLPARTIPDRPERVTPAAIPGLEIRSADARKPPAGCSEAFASAFPGRVRGSMASPPHA